MKALYKMKPNSLKETFEITDEVKGAAHYLVETEDGFLVLVDAERGRLCLDFDVVLVQKALHSGKSYGPPGMNIGPMVRALQRRRQRRSSAFWNQQVGQCGLSARL